jgi:hypothetical protein
MVIQIPNRSLPKYGIINRMLTSITTSAVPRLSALATTVVEARR